MRLELGGVLVFKMRPNKESSERSCKSEELKYCPVESAAKSQTATLQHGQANPIG